MSELMENFKASLATAINTYIQDKEVLSPNRKQDIALMREIIETDNISEKLLRKRFEDIYENMEGFWVKFIGQSDLWDHVSKVLYDPEFSRDAFVDEQLKILTERTAYAANNVLEHPRVLSLRAEHQSELAAKDIEIEHYKSLLDESEDEKDTLRTMLSTSHQENSSLREVCDKLQKENDRLRKKANENARAGSARWSSINSRHDDVADNPMPHAGLHEQTQRRYAFEL